MNYTGSPPSITATFAQSPKPPPTMSAASPPTQLDQHSAPLLTPSDGHARRPAAAYVADSPRRGAPDHSGGPDGQIKISSGKETTSRRLCGSRTWLRPHDAPSRVWRAAAA